MAASKASILIFEMNKKYLLYKILTKELKNHLRAEVWKNFGAKYVNEKSEQSEKFYNGGKNNENSENEANEANEAKADDSTDTNNNNKTNKSNSLNNFNLTDDLIYEYFSALVASFEISKELEFIYEYALFDQNKYIIRFHVHKNFLLLIILNVTLDYSSSSSSSSSSDFRNQLYSEYFTSWFCKSIISLIRYKFGISTDERCFKETDESSQLEIKSFFAKWSHYFMSENLYFIEAIEKLERFGIKKVNEDIRKKCEQFVGELSDCLEKAEGLWSDEEDEEKSTNGGESAEGDEDFKFFGNDEDGAPSSMTGSSSQQHQKPKNTESVEFERFFSKDLKLINQFILSYGGRLLYKNAPNIDSTSLFMLLLESAHFLDYRCGSNESAEFDEFDEETDYESASSNDDSVESVIEESNENSNGNNINNRPNSNANGENNESAANMTAKPSYSETFAESFRSVMSTPYRFNENSEVFKADDSESKLGRRSDLETNKSASINHKRLKLVNCFLHTSNGASIVQYETFFFKLADNLCLILLKPNKFAKYCELMADFDTLIGEFADQIAKKRNESWSNSNEDNETMSLTTSTTTTNRVKRADGSFSSVSPAAQIEDEKQRLSKAFYSFFVNKMIIVFEKLKNLKTDLNARSMSKREGSKDSLFSRALSLNNRRSKQSFDETYNSLKYSASLDSQSTLDKAAIIKLINLLLVKIQQFNDSRQFKNFINGVNTGTNTHIPNANINTLNNQQPSSEEADLRYIESQLSAIRTNLNDLFYDLFLSKSMSNLVKSTTTRSTSRTSSNPKQLEFTLKPKSNYIFEQLETLYSKHLYHYCPYMEIKLKRNVSMAYYSYLLPGLVHFSFVNRQDNTCVIPTIDAALNYNLNEAKILQAYRKYVPIVMKFLYSYECAEFRFWDDRLNAVVSYLMWFEDRGGNRLSADFNRRVSAASVKKAGVGATRNNSAGVFETGVAGSGGSAGIIEWSTQQQQQRLNKRAYLPGITEKDGFYEHVKAACYPNAPAESLTCYELFCLHSDRIKEERIDKQFRYLVANLAKIVKTNA